MLKPIGFLLLIISVQGSFASSVTVIGPSANPNVGDTFVVDVSATGISDLYALQFDLSFNPALLSADSATEGGFLPTGGTTFFIPGTIDNIGGTISATADSLIGAIPGVSGSGILAQFQFTALAPGGSSLNFANEIFLDSSLNDITSNATFVNGSVTVASVPEPSPLKPLGVAVLLFMLVSQITNPTLWRLFLMRRMKGQ